MAWVLGIPGKVGLGLSHLYAAVLIFSPPDKQSCSINPLGNSGRRNAELACNHLGTFHEKTLQSRGFHAQPLLLMQTLPRSPSPAPTPPLSPAVPPARPAPVPFFGNILYHTPVSVQHLPVGRIAHQGCSARPPRCRQGCSPQPSSPSSRFSPCSSSAPTVPPAHTARAWLRVAQEAVPSSRRPPHASPGPCERARPVRLRWLGRRWQQLSGMGSFTTLFHTWCHVAGTPALRNRQGFVKGFVRSVSISGVPE